MMDSAPVALTMMYPTVTSTSCIVLVEGRAVVVMHGAAVALAVMVRTVTNPARNIADDWLMA
ncbi:MAG: hypothetical protein DWQ31_19650 [Planctomycetota bacterium]|nr:MAG: hypothetical protein DWQ31_19650 [Planctomycetota bacterium]REJ88755.1 MAG: hypothetical protein DWQ35_19320 [Planctomycetota bacterium]REK26596.1 MAG: hypothetical protein DWQ42_08715 [Planctomycetota bacterium]REK46097.1 MAG: hypothetical protein DWQ46_07240 [Planctomycetota bacterium]